MLTPAFLLAILLILLIFAFKIGISQIAILRTAINEAHKKENILKQKQDVLMRLDSEIPSQAKLIVAVLPGKNSSLLALYQIKTLAAEKAVIFSNFKVGAEIKEKSDLARADLTFDVEGDIVSVISFLSSLKTIAPVLIIDRADLSILGSLATAAVRIRSYWSAYPTQLPSLTEPIKEMTDEEREILAQVLALTPPPFVQLSAFPPVERNDPFNLQW